MIINGNIFIHLHMNKALVVQCRTKIMLVQNYKIISEIPLEKTCAVAKEIEYSIKIGLQTEKSDFRVGILLLITAFRWFQF